MPTWEDDWARQRREAREKREREDAEYDRQQAEEKAARAQRDAANAKKEAERARYAAAEEIDVMREEIDEAFTELRREKHRGALLVKTARAFLKELLHNISGPQPHNFRGEFWRGLEQLQELLRQFPTEEET